MTYLILSIAALFLGPLAVHLGGMRQRVLAALDGFVLVAVGGLMLLHLLPHSVELVGWWAVLAAGVGFVLPAMLERSMHRLEHEATPVILVLIVLGLVVHTVLDGAVLVDGGDPDAPSSLLALGVVLHNMPVGLVLWWALAPVWGAVRTLLLLALVAGGTVFGFVLGETGLQALPVEAMTVLQAVVAGSLLHVVVDHPRRLHLPEGRWRHLPAVGGAAVGVGMLVFLAVASEATHGSHAHVGHVHAGHAHVDHGGVGDTFLALALQSAPALLIAFIGAGLVHAFTGSSAVRWLRRAGAAGQAARGVVFGLPLPTCSCGVLPVYRSLSQAGVPATGALAFLIATPALGLDAVLISVPLLGGEVTVARVAATVLVAFLGALLLGRLVRRGGEAADATLHDVPIRRPDGEPVGRRLRSGLAYGLGDMVDHVLPWLLVCLLVAAALAPALEGGALLTLPRGVDVPLMALIGIPTYVSASAATPIVAVLVFFGLSPGAAIAFLLTGPATNLVTFGVLRRLHSARFAMAFGATVAALAVGLGYLVNAWLPAGGLVPAPALDGATALQWVCLAGLGLLVAGSLVRQGPRRFVGEVFEIWGDARIHAQHGCPICEPEEHCDGHGHGHGHGHSHGHSHGRVPAHVHGHDEPHGHAHAGHDHDHEHVHDLAAPAPAHAPRVKDGHGHG